MPLTELNHYFVRVRDLERSRSFYCEVLGFSLMPRPDLPFPGYWLGVNGKVQVHMGPDGIDDEAHHYYGTSRRSARDNAGVIDHIAFQGSDPDTLAMHLEQRGVAMRSRYLGEIQLLQIFVADPDGLMIELNFPGVTEAPAWAHRDAA